MPKSANQKLKLLFLTDILYKKTDEQHPLNTKELISELAFYDIEAERKSIYSDIEALQSYGMDIILKKGKNGGYYVASRDFELPELKLLADAVASSKFITATKSQKLIKKIEGLTNGYNASQLKRQLIVSNRVKTENEQIFYNVDTLHNAINSRVKITFLYYTYDLNKRKIYRNNRERYTVSPYALSWDDENYYLICFHEGRQAISSFRVDKMEKIVLTEEKITKAPEGFDPVSYSKKVFSMFSGEEAEVTLEFDESLINVVLDRFGKEIYIIKRPDSKFRINVKVIASPSFFAWLLQFGNKAKIIEPALVKENMLKLIEEIKASYE